MTKRIRTRGSMSSITGYQETYYTNGTTGLTGPYSVGQVGEVTTTVDYPTPGYARRSAAGETIITPFSSITERRTNQLRGWALSNNMSGSPPPTSYGSACLVPRFLITVPSAGLCNATDVLSESTVTALRATAGTQAMANIEPPDVQGQVFLAELKKTLKMVSDIRKELLNALVYSFGRSAKANARRLKRNLTMQELESQYLRYRYGVRPLLYDLEGAVKALYAAQRASLRTSRGTSSGSSNVVTTNQNFSDSLCDYAVSTSRRETVDFRAGVRYRVDLRLVDPFGTGIDQLPSTLWELTPWSFVIDWFSNTGEYIKAMTPRVGVNVIGTWTTMNRVRYADRTVNATHKSSWAGVNTLTTDPGGSDHHVILHKRRYTEVFTGLTADLELSKNALLHAADGFALAHQQVRRFGRL